MSHIPQSFLSDVSKRAGLVHMDDIRSFEAWLQDQLDSLPVTKPDAGQVKFQKLLISARYWLLGMAEADPAYFTVLRALELAAEHHDGERNGGDPEFVHQLGIFHYLRTMHKHITNPVTVYSLIFMHDILEDPNQRSKRDGKPIYIEPATIRDEFGEVIFAKVVKMSKELLGQKNPAYSLEAIFDDEDCSLAKGGDRVDNVRSMIGVFKRDRLKRYITETMDHFVPGLKHARRKFPHQEAIYENMKLELVGTLTLISHILDGYVPNDDAT